MRRACLLIPLCLALAATLVVGCTAPTAPTLSAGPAAPVTPPTATGSPSPAASTPSGSPATSGVFELFQPVAGFTFEPVSGDILEGFEEAAAASLGDSGSIGDAHAAQAVRAGSEPVTVVAFTLVPQAADSEDDLLAEILDGIAAGAGGEWTPDDSAGFLVLKGAETTSVVGPWGTLRGATVFLFATGAADAPVEELVRALFESS